MLNILICYGFLYTCLSFLFPLSLLSFMLMIILYLHSHTFYLSSCIVSQILQGSNHNPINYSQKYKVFKLLVSENADSKIKVMILTLNFCVLICFNVLNVIVIVIVIMWYRPGSLELPQKKSPLPAPKFARRLKPSGIESDPKTKTIPKTQIPKVVADRRSPRIPLNEVLLQLEFVDLVYAICIYDMMILFKYSVL